MARPSRRPQWHRDAGRDPKALPQLFEDWETETMHAQGWVPPQPAAQPAARPGSPAPLRLVPRGHG
ncbi:hypothetical protein BEH93_28950 [Streptomyces sp. 2R]|nr:hypothetical protein BEH93_28950 [Streptomyces sp. 2R]